MCWQRLWGSGFPLRRSGGGDNDLPSPPDGREHCGNVRDPDRDLRPSLPPRVCVAPLRRRSDRPTVLQSRRCWRRLAPPRGLGIPWPHALARRAGVRALRRVDQEARPAPSSEPGREAEGRVLARERSKSAPRCRRGTARVPVRARPQRRWFWPDADSDSGCTPRPPSSWSAIDRHA